MERSCRWRRGRGEVPKSSFADGRQHAEAPDRDAEAGRGIEELARKQFGSAQPSQRSSASSGGGSRVETAGWSG